MLQTVTIHDSTVTRYISKFEIHNNYCHGWPSNNLSNSNLTTSNLNLTNSNSAHACNMDADDERLTAEEAEQYDRQIRLWGLEAQKR